MSKPSNRGLTGQTLKIYWQHTKPYKKAMMIIYPTMLLAQIIEDFIGPLLISMILVKLSQNRLSELALDKIWPILVVIVLCEVIGHTLWNKVIVPKFWRTQDAIMRDLNLTVFSHLQKMSYRFFSDRFAGSLVSQTNKFVASYERLTDPLTWNVYKLIIALVATSVILLPKAPYVVLAIVLISCVYAPVIWIYRRKQLPLNKKWAAADSKRTGQLADTISNIMAVKSFAGEPGEYQLMADRANDVHNRSIDTMKMSMKQEFVSGLIQRSINISTILISVILAVNGRIDVGVIYLSLNFVMGIMRRLWDLNNTFRQFTRVFGDAGDMTEILQIEPEVADPNTPLPFEANSGKIDFKSVDFWYPDRSASDSLFKNLSISFNPGEKIGLVGPSGGGKTTITKLLLRFMDIPAGVITIDGQDISKVAQADLRRAITYVPQEPLLFHRSISDNIAYGNPTATKEMIHNAAKRAQADVFIDKLSNGYDTMVGERGVKLSGGQKQRIAIARAMLKDAPIVVLDEATSALDSESEAAIQKALQELMKHKTAVVIAHRLSTIKHLDKIIVMDNGKIVESGTHDELRKIKSGLYAKLWSHQSGGFLIED